MSEGDEAASFYMIPEVFEINENSPPHPLYLTQTPVILSEMTEFARERSEGSPGTCRY
jgi:hypothetical protein